MLRSVIKSTTTTTMTTTTTTTTTSMAGVEKARNRPQTQRNDDDFDDNLEYIFNCEKPAL
jgi:hypothetical protein